MIASRSFLAGCLLFFAGSGAGMAQAADALPLTELAGPGRILMLRHANAPGTGDPDQFRLDDCATQRNLDTAGRTQAKRLGKRLAQAGIVQAKVYSSQWCRCLETARLIGLGAVTAQPALNSFYQQWDERERRMAALRQFLSALPADGSPVVLVTHQMTIAQFTGAGMPAGGGSLFQLDGSGQPRWLGAIASD